MTELLKTALNSSINAYVELFAKKQSMNFEGWVADEVGSIAGFSGGYFIDFLTIKHDFRNEKK